MLSPLNQEHRPGLSGNPRGFVYLVGAGPGDPGMFTLRGAEVLQQAEVVIYDGLVNSELLHLAPASAQIIFGGKHDRCRASTQDEINAALLLHARQGRRVVRLKGGDPFLFGRGGEEAALLAREGIPFAIVPGVSSIQAVPAYAGIPLTHRDHASALTVITGHETPGGPSDKQDWAGLGRARGTLVVLMGLKNLPEISAALIAHGRAPDTPVAVISRGSVGGQKTIVGRLATINQEVSRTQIPPPAVIVIGDVVSFRNQLCWHDRLPLAARRIVVTQRHDLAVPLMNLLHAQGAHLIEIPASRFRPPLDPAPLRNALDCLPSYDWILFSSPRTIEVFFDQLLGRWGDVRALGPVRLGVYGPMTAECLRQRGLHPVAVAPDHKTPLIIDALRKSGLEKNQKILLLRGEVALEHVPEALRDLGAHVDVVACFGLEPDADDRTGASASLVERGVEWIIFASGLAIEHFHHRFNLPDLQTRFPQLKFALASPTINWALKKLGLQPAVVAQPNDPVSLTTEIIQYEVQQSAGRPCVPAKSPLALAESSLSLGSVQK
jgi:uroporphyrinogen III methyltransferase / synthase